MKVMIFTEGTLLMPGALAGLARQEIVKQVNQGTNPALADFAASIPIGDCVRKIDSWKRQGAVIVYLTSRRTPEEVQTIKNVLQKYGFPEGELLFRKGTEAYKDVVKRALPDVIVEDDCESIGGEVEMTYPRIRPDLKQKIKSIVVKEFGGIDHLPDKASDLI